MNLCLEINLLSLQSFVLCVEFIRRLCTLFFAVQLQIDNQVVTNFLQELVLMKDFNHPNVLGIIGISVNDNRPCAILPLMSNGDLKTYLRKNKSVRTFFVSAAFTNMSGCFLIFMWNPSLFAFSGPVPSKPSELCSLSCKRNAVSCQSGCGSL